MKRLSNFLIVALAALFLAVGFAACGSNGGNGTGGGDKPSGGHTHTFVETVIEPTCTEKGYTIHKCECGEKYEDSYVSALDHKLGEWNVTTPATEEKDGEETRVCTRENCDYFETRKIPKLDHTHEYTETVIEPTCTEKGYTLHKCECGEEYKDGETEALGHLFGAWETITPATEDSEGLEQRVCARKNCGFKEERAIPVLSHTHNYITTTIEPTCTERGYTKYTCEKCGNSYNADYEKPLGHDYSTEWIVDKEATCTETGIKSHHCTRCEAKTDETEIPLADHNYVDGVCTVCGNKTIEEATGLEYTLSTDKTYYIVSELGEETRTRFSIPSVHNGLPVKEIGDISFYKKNNIVQVVLPDSIEKIGNKAFYQCIELREVVLGKGLQTIAEQAFSGCDKLIKTIKGVSYVDKWVIECEKSVTKVELKADTVGIADSAFQYCSSLTSITIPDSVTSIGSYAFDNCSSLKRVYITDIAAWCNIKFGDNPFYYAHNLYLYLNNELVTDLIIPDGVTSIGNLTFAYCSLASITIPDSVTSIGSDAFKDCGSLEKITVSDNNVKYASVDGILYDKNKTYIIYIPKNIKGDITIPDSVTSIGEQAFYYCRSLTSINISDSVTSIGNYAFGYCSSLTSVAIGNGVTSIGYEAFYNCSSLTSINIPDSVTSIVSEAFYNCSSLTSVTIGNGVTSIGYEAFYNCSSLKSVIIGNGVTGIGDRAFNGCSSLTGVYITDIAAWCNIWFGGDYGNPLYYAHNLYLNNELVTDLVIPDGVTGIGDEVFRYCSSLTSINISDSVTSIGNYAFEDCSSLTSVTIGNGVTSIGNYAFYNCSSLTSVTIGNGVTSIGEYAFSCCYSLTSVTIPDSVTSIGEYAFYNCSSLTSVTIGSGVTSIGDAAFWNCRSLTSVTIGNGVTSIGDNAFDACFYLTDITYNGTKAEWKKITKEDGWKNYTGGYFTVHCTDGDLTKDEA